MKGDRLHAFYVIAITGGLRLGELLALRWADIDLQAASISVRRTLVESGGKVSIGEPKTAKGRRRVELPTLAVEGLREHRKAMLAAGTPGPLVFPAPRGGFMRPSNLRNRSFLPLLKKAKLPRIRLQDLRHTCATRLLRAGVHPKIVSERLGHATVGITLDTYSHVLRSMQKDAASQLDAMLDGGGSDSEGDTGSHHRR